MRIGIVGPFNPAFVADYLEEKEVPSINGAATAVNTLVREFIEQGHHVTVFTLHSLLPNTYSVLHGKNIEVHLIPSGMMPRLMGYHQLVIGQFYLPRRIAKVIRQNISNLDVLHAHWTYEYAKAILPFSGQLPIFDTVRDWCPYQLSIMKGRSRLDWQLKNITFKQVMAEKRMTFIANSAYTKRMITEAYPDKLVPVIPNPIDKSWILTEKKLEARHKIVSIATGLISPRKNIGTLLEAFAMYRKDYPEAELHLVGGYEDESETFKSWKDNGWLQGVTLHGSLPHDDLAMLLDQISCLVHPSVEETFGNILLEAMSRCVPCIGGEDAGAVPDVLGRGKYGIVCDIKSPKAIYEAMVKMNKPEVALQIQQEATKMLKDYYSSDVIVKKHIELFVKYN